MGLRSPALLVLLAVTAAVLLMVTLRRWPAVARRAPRAVLERIVLLATLQATVLALIFVTVNREQQFYASWSDLFGGQLTAGHVQAVTLGSASPPGQLRVLARETVTAPGTARAKAGELLKARFAGPVSGLKPTGYVFLPPGYTRAGPRLPVVVVVSGQAGSHTAVYGAQRVAVTAEAGMAAGRLPRMIVVTLPPDAGGKPNPGCLDMPGSSQATTFFTQDLPQVLTGRFRASPQPSQWAVLADDSGGYCALQLATSVAGPFAAAVVPDGAYTSPPGKPAQTRWLREQDSVAWRLLHWPPPPLQVLVTDPGSGASSLLPLVRPPMRATSSTLAPGVQPLGPVLGWVGQALAGA
jgi:Putative esterase